MRSSPPIENRTIGILWMLATMFCFIALDAITKYALEYYSLVQVTWGRLFFAMIFAVMLCGRRIRDLARSTTPGVQIVRALLLMITTGLFNAGVSKLPLATTTTIMFMSPIIVTLLSIGLLGERVGLRSWFGILTGFAGAIVVVRPWQTVSDTFSTGALFLLAATLTNAAYQIATRKVRHDDPLTSLLYTASAGAIVTSLILPGHWETPDTTGWLLLIGSGAAGCAGHLCLIRAFRSAPASVVAPFAYSSLIWATFFGYAIWRELPDAETWIGAALIVAAGLYIWFRERQRGAPTKDAAAPL